MARVFSKDAARQSFELQEVMDAENAAAQAERTNGPGAADVAALTPFEDQGSHPGAKDGQVQMFRKGDKAWAYSWSEGNNTWLEIGEVTGVGQQKKELNGEQYDHVFDIQVDRTGGADSLRIGMNAGDNPWMIAQNFVNEHMLEQQDLPQIADFLIKNTTGEQTPTLGMGGGGGGGAIGMEVDAGPAAPSYKHFPKTGAALFDTVPKSFDVLLQKLRASNAELAAGVALTEAEMEAVQAMVEVVKDVSHWHATRINAPWIRALNKLLQWPQQHVFPAIDLARLVVLHADGSTKVAGSSPSVTASVLACAAPGAPMAVQLLVARFASNLGSTQAGREQLMQHHGAVLAAVAACGDSNKNVRLACATALLNTTVAACDPLKHASNASQFDSAKFCAVAAQLGGAFDPVADAEAVYRLLAAAGTVVVSKTAPASMFAEMMGAVMPLDGSSGTTQNVQQCAAELTRACN